MPSNDTERTKITTHKPMYLSLFNISIFSNFIHISIPRKTLKCEQNFKISQFKYKLNPNCYNYHDKCFIISKNHEF